MKKFPLIAAIAALSLIACSPSGSVSSSNSDASTSQSGLQHIYLNYSALNLAIGGKAQLKVYLELSAQNEVDPSRCTFVSESPSVASVSSSGEVEGLIAGETLITVTYEGISATVLVTVRGDSPIETASAYQREGSLSSSFDIAVLGSSLLNGNFSSPLALSYTVDTSGHKDTSDSGIMAFEFSPNESASESVTPENNFAFLSSIFNIQTVTNLIATFAPSLDLDLDLPGQYKAMGATYSGFSSLSPYDEHFYLLETGDRSSFTSYADVSGTNMVRMQEKWDSLSVPIETIQQVLSYLATTDLSSVDYVSYINQYIQDGELLPSSSSTTVQIVMGVLLFLVNQFNITKTAVTVGAYEGVNFLFHPKDASLTSLNETLATLLENLGVSLGNFSLSAKAMNLSFTIYTDEASNTCLRDLSFDIGIDIDGSFELSGFPIDGSASLTLDFAYEMGHEKTALTDEYLPALVSMDKAFDATTSSFESFYEKIAPVVEYYDGDAPYSGIDITNAYGSTLQGYVEEYALLSEATKFMLTDKVSETTIMEKYNDGRTSLQLTAAAIALSVSTGTLTYSLVRTEMIALSRYKNWGVALKEYDYQGLIVSVSGEEMYSAILTAEQNYFKTITDEMSAVSTELASYDASSMSVADSVTLFSRAHTALAESSGSLNYFANENANLLLDEMLEGVDGAFLIAESILSSLYSSVLAKFKSILDSDLANQAKLDDLSALLIGSGSTTLFSNWMTSLNGQEFVSGGKRGDFLNDIAENYSDSLLNMNASLVADKRKEGYPQYGSETWSSFVSEANSLIDEISSLERAIYGEERTDLSSLRTLVSD